MAQELEDGGFWLPSDFLTDEDDLLLELIPDPLKTKASNDFSHGYTSFFNSDLSSPVDPVMCLTETESDEDAGLTRNVAARSALLDFDLLSNNNLKDGRLPSSPQSTLCACNRVAGANRVSRFSSPPVAAAGKPGVKQMRQGTTSFMSTNLFAAPPQIFPPGPTQTETQAQLACLQLQAIQFQHMKQLQTMELGSWGEAGKTQGLLSMAASPTLQQPQPLQPPGSVKRPVYHGEIGLNKRRTGTGVFLPRPYEPNSTETRKKQANSTALIPDWVV